MSRFMGYRRLGGLCIGVLSRVVGIALVLCRLRSDPRVVLVCVIGSEVRYI